MSVDALALDVDGLTATDVAARDRYRGRGTAVSTVVDQGPSSARGTTATLSRRR